MKELKEKSFTVYVTLNDDSNVQTMLENLYNETFITKVHCAMTIFILMPRTLYQTDITRA